MIKQDIVKRVYETARGGLTGREAASLVDTVFDIIRDTLASGEGVKISSFGVFTVREKRSRAGRNPYTGERLRIAARRVVRFKTSAILRDKLGSARKSSAGR